MTTVEDPDPPAPSLSTKEPGYEPIAGYILVEPLGRGDLGEVWTCESPEGLHKVVKFLTKEAYGCAGQDSNRLQQLTTIRHPHLLSLERVERVGNELVMITELAECQLDDRLRECWQVGLPGIPRPELLEYLAEAAEALDVIASQYGLHHLNLKPSNMFLTAGRVQVGDYRPVCNLDNPIPKYAAPEVLEGQFHSRSDQYSLALVYYELLTGKIPYFDRKHDQVMIQNAARAADLSGPVGTALARNPEQRFPSCRQFIQALSSIRVAPPINLITPGRAAGRTNSTPTPHAATEARVNSASTEPMTGRSSIASPAPTDAPSPQLVWVNRTRSPRVAKSIAPPPRQSAPPPAIPPIPPSGVLLHDILSVIPIAWLQGEKSPVPDLPPVKIVRDLMAAVGSSNSGPSTSGEVERLPDGALGCRFLCKIDPRIAKLKLALLLDGRDLTMNSRDDRTVVFRQENALAPPVPPGLFASFGKKPTPPPPAPSGLEVVVLLPESGTAVGEIAVRGKVFGSPAPDIAKRSEDVFIGIVEETQRHLNNFEERRTDPRIPTDLPLLLYPLDQDGRAGSPLSGRTQDISASGLGFRTTTPPPGEFGYLVFENAPEAAGLALLYQILRSTRLDDGTFVIGGRFRLDL